MPHHNDQHSSTGTGQKVDGTTRPMWGNFSQKYRSDWESRFSNRPWGQYEHAFRYGWEGAQNDRFRDRDFTSSQGDLERDWPNRYNNWSDHAGDKVEGVWNDFKETVREGWESARREFNKAF
jgi:hypothetical protein